MNTPLYPPSLIPAAPELSPFLLSLQNQLLDVLNENSSADVPYHNNRHMKAVWEIARLLWQTEQCEIGLHEHDPDWALVVLMFATLLHDYHHSAGATTDDLNVQRARGFTQTLLNHCTAGMPSRVIHAIDAAIECTQFPFVVDPRNKLEMVLRDADLLYGVVTNDPTILLEGLRREMEVARGHVISYEEMISGQNAFMQSVRMFTDTGQKYWDECVPQFLAGIEEYVATKRQAETRRTEHQSSASRQHPA